MSEKFPNPDQQDKVGAGIEAVATELESVLLEIVNTKKQIEEARKSIEESQREMEEIIAFLDPSDPEDQKKIEDMQRQQASFKEDVGGVIQSLEGIVTSLEGIHKSELGMFEDFKAMKREKDFGSSGTAH